MHPSTALATVVVDELVRCGVREVVLCPGSRSAPLAYAALAAEQAGRLRLHVRIDERTAGFLALGLAKVSGVPAAVITTSGTAVANLHPAVLEAHHASVPLLVLSADRPARLRGTGANQTTHQPGIFEQAVCFAADVPATEATPAHAASWRSTVDRAIAAATGARTGAGGPAHLNLAFDEPLVPAMPAADPGIGADSALGGRDNGAPWVQVSGSAPTSPDAGEADLLVAALSERTMVVLGDLPEPGQAAEVLAQASSAGFPVVAEPFGAGVRGQVLAHGPLPLLAAGQTLRPEVILVVGRLTLSRDVAGYLRTSGARVLTLTPGVTWADPAHHASEVFGWGALAGVGRARADAAWADAWRKVGERVAGAVGERLQAAWPSGPAVAGVVLDGLTSSDVLVVGSSNACRDLDLADPGHNERATVVANRGLAGIDGTLSTALGVALAHHGRTVALVGDLTFLHDLNGLVLGPDESRPGLTVVVVNDDGGGIFSTLEYGDPSRLAGDGQAAFERIFTTATGADLAQLCRGLGVDHRRAESSADLRAALRESNGQGVLTVIEVPVPQEGHRRLREELRAVARAAGAGG